MAIMNTAPGEPSEVSAFMAEVTGFLPKRKLSWRKKGQIFDVVKPLFIGYMFVSADRQRIIELDFWLRSQRLDAWFLKPGKDLTHVIPEEMDLVKRLTSDGSIVEQSEVVKEGERVKIVRGTLVGMEGIIVGLSKRSRRIIISITIGGEEKSRSGWNMVGPGMIFNFYRGKVMY